jgi:hypothetical protein
LTFEFRILVQTYHLHVHSLVYTCQRHLRCERVFTRHCVTCRIGSRAAGTFRYMSSMTPHWCAKQTCNSFLKNCVTQITPSVDRTQIRQVGCIWTLNMTRRNVLCVSHMHAHDTFPIHVSEHSLILVCDTTPLQVSCCRCRCDC